MDIFIKKLQLSELNKIKKSFNKKIIQLGSGPNIEVDYIIEEINKNLHILVDKISKIIKEKDSDSKYIELKEKLKEIDDVVHTIKGGSGSKNNFDTDKEYNFINKNYLKLNKLAKKHMDDNSIFLKELLNNNDSSESELYTSDSDDNIIYHPRFVANNPNIPNMISPIKNIDLKYNKANIPNIPNMESPIKNIDLKYNKAYNYLDKLNSVIKDINSI